MIATILSQDLDMRLRKRFLIKHQLYKAQKINISTVVRKTAHQIFTLSLSKTRIKMFINHLLKPFLRNTPLRLKPPSFNYFSNISIILIFRTDLIH